MKSVRVLYMHLSIAVAFLIASVTCVVSEHAEDANQSHPMETEGMFQGDIVPEPVTRYHFKHKHKTWPNGVVYYKISPELEKYSDAITTAMKEIEDNSCVRFEQYRWSFFSRNDYIYIADGTGCWSNIGYQRRGKQELSLGDGCRDNGSILHELMHAIGFGHMHCNLNRDKYIRIHWENIAEGKEHNFQVLDPYWYEMSIFDYTSIMLYRSTAFTKKYPLVTMDTLSGHQLHEQQHLSNNDIYYINKVYGCEMNNLKLMAPIETEY